MWASLRRIRSHVPRPELRSGWADRKKISPISSRGGTKRIAERMAPMMLPGWASSVLSITTKSPYAIRALTELARTGGAGPVPIGELARRREIPVQFLEQLFVAPRPGRKLGAGGRQIAGRPVGRRRGAQFRGGGRPRPRRAREGDDQRRRR